MTTGCIFVYKSTVPEFSCNVLLSFCLIPPANEVWGKVIFFSQVCVKNSVHRGGGAIPACLAAGLQGGAIPACIAVGIPAYLAAGLGGGWVPSLGGMGVCSQGESAHGGVCPWGCLVETPSPRDGYCCGWYASYWNAFLLFFFLLAVRPHHCWGADAKTENRNGNVNFTTKLNPTVLPPAKARKRTNWCNCIFQ